MVSAGAACSSGKVGAEPCADGDGVPPELAAATIRVSLGWSTTEADIDRFVDAWTALYRRRRGFAERRTRNNARSESARRMSSPHGHAANAPPIYLDNQATTPARPARARGDAALFHRAFRQSRTAPATPTAMMPPRRSSGRAAEIAALIHADPREIVFTSGATEANNLAIKGAAHFARAHPARTFRQLAAKPYRDLGDRAQMRARKLRRARARGVRGHLSAGRARWPRRSRQAGGGA